MHLFDSQYHVGRITYPKATIMHDLSEVYAKIFETLRSLTEDYFDNTGNSRAYPHPPKMSDLEVIRLTMAAESVQIISENLLWSKLTKDYPELFPELIHRVSYNRRKKALREAFLHCMEVVATPLVKDSELFVIDSIPIPTCRIVRERSSKACRREDRDLVLADKGYNRIMGGYYIGYKMHLISSKSSVYRDILITPASSHDSVFTKEIGSADEHLKGRSFLGDRAYIGKATQLRLFEELNLQLNVPYRRNQKDFKTYDPELRLKRKSIEVVFSQYCDEFQLSQNYAKRFEGFEIRILSKIAANTFKQYWNFLNGRKLNQTKHALAA